MIRLAIVISLALSMCSEPPEREEVVPEPEPVAELPPTDPPEPAQPAQPVEPPGQPPIAAPQLVGLFALTWRQDSDRAPRVDEPQPVAGCEWARWGWDFRSDGTLGISSETMCPAPPQLHEGEGHGVCRAELVTNVRWHRGGFSIPAPVGAQSRFLHFRRREQDRARFDTATVRCNVNVGAISATLMDVVPGDAATRPREVTLLLSDGARWHLEAVEEANHAELILERAPP
jgi:hypothetical protein